MKVTFTAPIEKFDKKGEKTGWTYVLIPSVQAEKLNPGCRVSFRVKGQLDHHTIERTSLLPMGNGDFILALNASIRKAVKKSIGESLSISLDLDKRELPLSEDLLLCLHDDPSALSHFESLTPSHQRYFSKWVEEAKTSATKTKRILCILEALNQKMGYPEMIRSYRKQ